MKITPLAIADVMLIEPQVFADDRGVFFESYNAAKLGEALGGATFPQDNHSVSRAGVVRGLHYQLPPSAQGKLVRVAVGAIFDVAVDVRRSSPSFGQWVGLELSAENRRELWIPPGFAHGFLALSEGAEVLYKASAPYDKATERSVRWDDPAIGIAWPQALPAVLSDKDAAAPLLADADLFA